MKQRDNGRKIAVIILSVAVVFNLGFLFAVVVLSYTNAPGYILYHSSMSTTTLKTTTVPQSYITATLLQCGINKGVFGNGTQLCDYQLPKGCIDEYYLFPLSNSTFNMQYGITCEQSGQNLPLTAQTNWTGG